NRGKNRSAWVSAADLSFGGTSWPTPHGYCRNPEYKLITKKTVIDQNRRMLFMCTSLISDYISTIKIS
ncbi:MAG: hypothetical protein ACYSSM_04205, partial [Planctomycetota bacterium]